MHRRPAIPTRVVLPLVLLACGFLAAAAMPPPLDADPTTPGEPVARTAKVIADSAETAKASGSKFFDPEDGQFDISGFLNTPGGFAPFLVPITEPAVGYGVGGALVFIRKNPPVVGGGYRKPNVLAVGGMATDDGSWAGFAAHTASWLDDRLQTVVAGVKGSIDLDFYGIGEGPFNEHPVGYDLEPAGGIAQAKYRIGRTPAQIGFGYGLVGFDAKFEQESLPEGVVPDELESRVGGVMPALVYDTRDNMFTPLNGVCAALEGGIFREWLGSSSDFERVRLTVIGYRPLTRKLYLGARGTVASTFGEAPFYARPFIALRGAPMMAYVGEDAASLEVEARWQFWKRVSAVGFVGTGSAWTDWMDFESSRDIATGGGGFRYEIARRFGLHMGVDIAWGPDEPALYVQFGNAWFRP